MCTSLRCVLRSNRLHACDREKETPKGGESTSRNGQIWEVDICKPHLHLRDHVLCCRAERVDDVNFNQCHGFVLALSKPREIERGLFVPVPSRLRRRQQQ